MEKESNEMDVGDLSALMSEGDEIRTNVYEIGYHLLPTLSEEEVTSVVASIMETIKKEGAEFIGDRFPSQTALAYSISKRIKEKNVNFDSAYFGWVAFEVVRPAALRLKEAFDANPSVLRHLTVVTDRNAIAAALSGAVDTSSESIEKPKREAETGGEMSEVALDEALKTIATEDAKVPE